MNVDSLNDVHIDVLKEVGNIGAGNATTALSKMLNRPIDMDVPKVRVLEFSDVATLIGGEEETVTGILLSLEGDIKGMMMFVLEHESSKKLVELLMGMKVEEFGEIETSAMKEIGNILTGSYLTSLSSLTNLSVVPSVPHLAVDMAGAILSVPAIEFGKVGDKVLFIETMFNQGDDSISGYYILIPEIGSFKTLLMSLGVA
ncbi:MAG: chemotaxis protein CheC [Clostridia bacterium]|jgi:chemotaxis protein CheC|nr:chemotaxis protein CheC [Clostridia bacterium]